MACLPQLLEQKHGQQQILLQAARAAVAHSSLVREERSSSGKLESSIMRPPIKPDIYAASSEPDNVRNSRPRLKPVVLYQGIALPGLNEVLRHQLYKKAERAIQDGPSPELAGMAELLKGRLGAKSCGQIRETIWGKPEIEYNSIKT